MTLDPAALGSHVRRIREDRALSARRLAAMTGLSRASIGRIEDGTGNPTIDSLSRIAVVLDVPVSALLGRGASAPGEVSIPTDDTPGQVQAPNETRHPDRRISRVAGTAETRVESNPVVVCRQVNRAWVLDLPASSESGQLRVSLYTLRPGEEPSGMAGSEHPEDDFSVVISGTFDALVGDQTYRLLEDDAIFIAGGQQHSMRLVGDTVGRMFVITLPPRR